MKRSTRRSWLCSLSSSSSRVMLVLASPSSPRAIAHAFVSRHTRWWWCAKRRMRAHARVVTRTARTEVVRNALDDSFARACGRVSRRGTCGAECGAWDYSVSRLTVFYNATAKRTPTPTVVVPCTLCDGNVLMRRSRSRLLTTRTHRGSSHVLYLDVVCVGW